MTNKTYKKKQDWLDAVMASDLNHATKTFAYGIFKHMYGDKETAFPGTKSLKQATGMKDHSKFTGHREALIKGGFLTAEVQKGRVYNYTLSYDYLNMCPEDTGTCVVETHDMCPEDTGHVPSGHTNTTSNTPKEDTNMNTTKRRSAPWNLSLPSENIAETIISQSPSFEEIVTPLLSERSFSLPETGDAAPVEVEVVKKSATEIAREKAEARRRATLTEVYGEGYLEGTW